MILQGFLSLVSSFRCVHLKIVSYNLHVNSVTKKIKIQYVLKKLLVKVIIVFISIYFQSYWKITARSNIYKDVINQNKQI